MSFVYSEGAKLSTDISVIYKERDAKCAKIVRLASSYIFYIVIIVHIIPTLSPLLYVLVGFPSPDSWYLSVLANEAWVNQIILIVLIKKLSNCSRQYLIFLFFFLKTSIFQNNSNLSMPFNDRTALGFEVAVIVDSICCWTFLFVVLTFFIIYSNVCLFLWSFIDDLKLTISHINEDIKLSHYSREKMRKYIALSVDCYRLYSILWIIF